MQGQIEGFLLLRQAVHSTGLLAYREVMCLAG